MKEKVAVVGGTGFVGANIVAELTRSRYTPIVVARRPERIKLALPELDVEARYGDLTEPNDPRAALRGCACVHSVAAMKGDVFTSPNPNHRKAAMRVNVAVTVDWLRAAHANGAQRAIVTSSCDTRYRRGGAAATEDSLAIGDQIVPDPHFTSKVHKQRAVADYARQTGLEVAIPLPATMIGPRDTCPTPLGGALLARLNGKASGGVSPGGAFPVVDARDVARAHVRAMETDDPRDAYLVVTETIDAQDWSDMVVHVTGLPPNGRIIPAKIAMPMAWLVDTSAKPRGKPSTFQPQRSAPHRPAPAV